MKVCPICNNEKPLESFPRYFDRKRNKERVYAYCLECKRSVYRKWHSENLDHRMRINKEWAEKNPDRHQAHSARCYRKREIERKAEIILANAKSRCGKESAYINVRFLLSRNEIKSLSKAYDEITLCPICQRDFDDKNHSTKKSFDRVKPHGNYEISNIQIICVGCNARKART